MTTTTMKFKLPKGLRHIELGKTLINKELYFEALDHFKKSIEENYEYGFDILIYLYKKQTQHEKYANLTIIISKIYLELSLFSNAINTLEEALETDSENELIYEELTKLITKKQLVPRIKLILEDAINQNIYFPCIIQMLPKIYLEEKSYSKAIDLYQNLIKIQPKEYNYYKVLSELYFRKRDYDAASNTLKELIEVAPFKSEELIQPIEQIIQKVPRQATIRILYSNILFRAFKPLEGCQEIETLIKYHPTKKETPIQLLKEQNKAFPNNPNILFLLADLLIESELYTESLEYIQEIIKGQPHFLDKCLVLMQKIIQYYPNHCLALEIIGHIYFQQENFHQAFYYFEQCIDGSEQPEALNLEELLIPIHLNSYEPTQFKAKLLLAKIYTKSNKTDDALALINELDQSEEEIEAILLKATLLNNNNDYLNALTEIQSLLKKHPYHWNIHKLANSTFKNYLDNKIATINQSEPSSNDLLLLGAIYAASNQTTSAIEILQKVSQSPPHEYEIAQQLIARIYFERSRFDLSDQIYLRIIKQSTNEKTIKECYYWMGLSQILLSNDEEAIQSFETIETYERNYLSTQQNLEALRKSKFLNHNGFVVIGTNVSKNEPKIALKKNHFGPQQSKSHQFEVIGFAQSYNDEGCKQIIKQQLKGAKESLQLAIQMDPKFYISYINLATVYIIEDDLEKALEQITLAEAITTNCPFLFCIKALCFFRKNDIEQAIRYIQQSIKLFPKESLFYIILGDFFYADRQIELAVTYWNKAAQHSEYQHWIQERFRKLHFNKINIDYWISPESLSFR